METPEQVLRRLQFKVVRRLDGFLFGDYTGIFYGPSLDLAEVREYQPGDEVRRIDWNVTARVHRLFVRQYREERELTAWLLVDRSPSMTFGTRRQLKRDTALEFAGVAAYIVTRHGDKIGLMSFPGRGPVIPPRGGRTQALHILHALSKADPDGDATIDLGLSLQQLARTVRRRSLIFLVSDFLSAGPWDRALRELARRHDLIAVWLYDPAELELPDIGGLFVQDVETGERVWVDTSDVRIRQAYRELVAQQRERVRTTFRGARVDVLELSTAEPLVDPLLEFITYRKRRSRWSSPGR